MGAVVRGGVTRGAKDLLSAGWRTVDGLTPLEAGTRGWEGHHARAGAGDPPLTQAELQGSALHPQAYRGAVRSPKHPIRLLERGQEVLAFGLFQGIVVLGAHSGGRRFAVGERHLPHGPWGEEHRPLKDLLQVANVPQPGILEARLHGLSGNGLDRVVPPAGERLGAIADQQRNRVRALPQRRPMHGKDVAPRAQVGTARRRRHHRRQVSVRGRDQPGIRPQGARQRERTP
jgi:hypothetical protein